MVGRRARIKPALAQVGTIHHLLTGLERPRGVFMSIETDLVHELADRRHAQDNPLGAALLADVGECLLRHHGIPGRVDHRAGLTADGPKRGTLREQKQSVRHKREPCLRPHAPRHLEESDDIRIEQRLAAEEMHMADRGELRLERGKIALDRLDLCEARLGERREMETALAVQIARVGKMHLDDVQDGAPRPAPVPRPDGDRPRQNGIDPPHRLQRPSLHSRHPRHLKLSNL